MKCFKQGWEIHSTWPIPNLGSSIISLKTHKWKNRTTRYLIWPLIKRRAAKIMLLIYTQSSIKSKINLQINMIWFQTGHRILREEVSSPKKRKSLCLPPYFWKKKDDPSLHLAVTNLNSMLELKAPSKALNLVYLRMKNFVNLLNKQNGKVVLHQVTNMRKSTTFLIRNRE